MRVFLLVTLLLWTAPLVGQTNAPLSAIDWLSQPGLTPLSEGNLVKRDPSQGATIDNITVIELDTPLEKNYGLIPLNISGIPLDFWTDVDPNTLKQIIGSLSESGLPASNDLFLRALLAVTSGNEAVLNLRVNTLIDRGAVSAAYNLLGQSKVDSLESFTLFAEVALLSDNVELMCNQLNAERHISNDEALQVYCQARTGSWDTALWNYFTYNTLGAFTPTTSNLLAAYLDPELASDLDLPTVDAERLTALEFTLRASVGKPVSTTSLPLKFAQSDLNKASGWKKQIEAAERLSAVGSLPALQLLDKYKSGKISASDKVWSRVFVVQNLDRALADPIIDPSQELLIFQNLMAGNNLVSSLSRAWADELNNFVTTKENNKIIFQMQILSNANTYKFKSKMAQLHSYNPEALGEHYETLMLQFEEGIPEPIPFRSASMLRGFKLISDALDGKKNALLEAIYIYQAMGLTTLAKQLAMEFTILAPSL